MNPFPIILSAPSGGGKTTIARELLDAAPTSATRYPARRGSPRPGEVDGHGLPLPDARRVPRRGAARANSPSRRKCTGICTGRCGVRSRGFSARAGTSSWTSTSRARGRCGQAFPESVTVFVLPPSGEVLLDRLRGPENRVARTACRAVTFSVAGVAGRRGVRVRRGQRRSRPCGAAGRGRSSTPKSSAASGSSGSTHQVQALDRTSWKRDRSPFIVTS